MRIALIGDVHGNLPALEATLAHAHRHGVEAIWNIGDFLGYGAFPDEVVRRLRKEDAVSIIGNYDAKVLKFKKKKKKWRKKKHPQKYLAFKWAHKNISKKSRKYLRSLPRQIRLEVEGWRVLLTHGSPDSIKEHLTPDTPDERLDELARMAEADVIVFGHSHRPFARQVDGVWFINTGSVGRPEDGDPRACYAILQLGPHRLKVRHHRVAYDVGRAMAAIRERGLPEEFAQMALQARNLDQVLEAQKAEESSRRLEGVLNLAESCDYEEEHTHQVTRLALRLFDELRPLHGLGHRERFWMRAGALLHDIGWIEGKRKHHKTALRFILESPLLPFEERERLIIGSIARYHRRALPKKKHDHFAALDEADQRTVCVLGGILRVADGLDRTHRDVVEDLWCEITRRKITVWCRVKWPPWLEQWAALDKGELLEQALDRELAIEWEVN